MAAPSLLQLAARFLLLHASEYEETSRQAISEMMAMLPPAASAAALSSTAALSRCALLPALLDSIRQHLVARPKSCRRMLNELLDAEMTADRAPGVVAACDQLLTVGMFKKDIRGGTFARPEGDLLRRLRKVAQRVAETSEGHEDWRQKIWRARLGDAQPTVWTLTAEQPWQREYRLRRLERYTG
jgi:hypothetical protein